MRFHTKITKIFHNIKSKYDLAAFCYDYLEKTVDSQIIFLGEYIGKNSHADATNPNSDLLNRFAVDIKKLLDEHAPSLFSSNEKSKLLLELLADTEAKLQSYGTYSFNRATIPFFILLGLDLHLNDPEKETSKDFSPFNNYLKESCLIYVNSKASIMDDIMNERNYPEKITANDLRHCLKRLIILKSSELPKGYGIPKLATLYKNEEIHDSLTKSKQIKIALIPTLNEPWFQFSVERGAAFVIKYNKQKTKAIKARILTLLKKAIECKAHIIVFPEYVCNREIQTEIGDCLSNMNRNEPEKMKELLFVVAGSGWTDDSNNVSCLYSYSGHPLGEMYKYSAYDNYIDNEHYIEQLKNPGKEITLIKVPDIGIFQTEICRDVSENEFCLKLSKVFDSQFLVITAWSSSVNIGFKKQADAIISKNHKTCLAMCNCCAALSENECFRNQISIAAAPQKNTSIIEGRYESVNREEGYCKKHCAEGCIFEVCYDFSGSSINDVIITSRQI